MDVRCGDRAVRWVVAVARVLLCIGDYRRAHTIGRSGIAAYAAGAHDRRLRWGLRTSPRLRVVVSPPKSGAPHPTHPDAGVAVRHDLCRGGAFHGRHRYPFGNRTLRSPGRHDRQCHSGIAVALGAPRTLDTRILERRWAANT